MQEDIRMLQTLQLAQAYQLTLLAGPTVAQEFTWFKCATLSSGLSVHTGEAIQARKVMS